MTHPVRPRPPELYGRFRIGWIRRADRYGASCPSGRSGDDPSWLRSDPGRGAGSGGGVRDGERWTRVPKDM